MGLVDKIKNALFEVEYVEEDKEDKKKNKNETENKDKPIARKVILASQKKNTENTENKDFDNLDNEIETLDISEDKPNDFKIMDDNDFKVDNDYPMDEEEPVQPAPIETLYQDEPKVEQRVIYKQDLNEKGPYGIDTASKNLVQDYGKAYEKKEERTGFKPSPIISPIYGVLDKNYKKEDVKDKKEVRLSSYSRESINVDDIRNKAYGEKEKPKVVENKEVEEKKNTIVVEEEDDSDLLVDLSKEGDKPLIKEVTMGDALEYFQDLGLEYNVDYMDVSKEKATGKRVNKVVTEEPELFSIEPDEKKDDAEILEDTVVSNNEEVSDKTEIDIENDGDNLFDLIESMYNEEK